MSPEPLREPTEPAPETTDDPGVAADEATLPVLELREGVPTPVTTRDGLLAAVEQLAGGTGPVAIDAERASGYRYSARAYLVQLRRAGAGTVLVDPVPVGSLAALGAALSDTEWVLHAASQDLPCLAEAGMTPTSLVDTELAGRLLGLPRVGLAGMVADLLGFHLEKGFSAADWSTRPLPGPWLRYAALDVEVLLELRELLVERLQEGGKLAWAQEEFAALVTRGTPPPRTEPWRRTSGLHRVRRRRQLGVVREVWQTRDEIARRSDTAPGRVLQDAAIVEAALAAPRSVEDLLALPTFSGRSARRRATQWVGAVRRGLAVPEADLPALGTPPEGPPPARSWGERDPAAARRLALARAAMGAIAAEHELPVENLLAPDIVRRLAWAPPADLDTAAVVTVAEELGARPWQVRLTAAGLAGALRQGVEGA